jgi:S-adenosylmethionine:tRNA ribosyltransferase-isomerase
VRTDLLDYELPEELVASFPTAARDGARLLVVDRASGARTHTRIAEIAAHLPPSLFIVNDTRVIPARVHGKKPTGGKVELLFVERLGATENAERWLALGRASNGLYDGDTILVGDVTVRVAAKRETGEIEILVPGDALVFLDAHGEMPLPPYLDRAEQPDDRERYQTRFARVPGAVAAPTAGLHFSDALITSLEAAGHRFARVTLHVGLGTFLPVKAEDLDAHPMHEERYVIDESTVAAIADARASGRMIVAIGTTVVRALESACGEDGVVRVGEGRTRLLIQPGYTFRVIDALVTNFHLPRSTLLALVMAFAGEANMRAAYADAIAERYRFFSYGDAMLIAKGARA